MKGRTVFAPNEWRAKLEALDHGHHAAEVSDLDSYVPDSDVASQLWRAELLIYAGRLDEAERGLQSLKTTFEPDLEARKQLLGGEILLWRGFHDPAAAVATTVLSDAGAGAVAHARARVLEVRAATRRGDFAFVTESAPAACEAAEGTGQKQQAVIARICRAFSLTRTTEIRRASRAWSEAIAAATAIADPRWEATARLGYGLLLADFGQFDAADEQYEAALRLTEGLGYGNEFFWALCNRANLHISTGSPARAASLLEPLYREARLSGEGPAELACLSTLTLAVALESKFEQVHEIALAAVRLAEMLGIKDALLTSRMFSEWATARRGSPGREALAALLDEVNEAGLPQQQYIGRLLLADALVALRPDRAWALWNEAQTLPDADTGDAYTQLSPFVLRRLELAPIRIGAGGEFIVDPSRGWPPFFEARALFELWFAERSMEEANGTKAEAARLIGLNRSQFHDLWQRVHGLPTRNGHVPDGRPRRRASRKQEPKAGDEDRELIDRARLR